MLRNCVDRPDEACPELVEGRRNPGGYGTISDAAPTRIAPGGLHPGYDTCKHLLGRSSGSWSFKNNIPKQEMSPLYTSVGVRHSGRDCRNPVHREVKLRVGNPQN